MDRPGKNTTVKPPPDNPRESFEFQTMANRVDPPEEPFSFPRMIPSPHREPAQQQQQQQPPEEHPPTPPAPPVTAPPPVTYVVQVPKVQIYRVPPPENAHRVNLYQESIRRKKRRCCGCSRCCFGWFLGTIVALLILIGVAVAISHFVLRPNPPKHSIKHVSIKGFHVSRNLTHSPEFIVTVKAQNPNKRIGIYYRKGSAVKVFYSDRSLCNGKLPTFYQNSLNVTILQTALTHSGAPLSNAFRRKLTAHETKGRVPLVLTLDLPVKYELRGVKKWLGTVRVHCDLKVDKLTADSRIVSEQCKTKVEVYDG